jgi:hypothetical protein
MKEFVTRDRRAWFSILAENGRDDWVNRAMTVMVFAPLVQFIHRLVAPDAIEQRAVLARINVKPFSP